MTFNLKQKNAVVQKTNMRTFRSGWAFIRASAVDIFRTFFISSLVLLNIGLIAIAGLWFLLVFSVVTPTELIEMYQVQPTQRSIAERSEYTLATIDVPPPPALTTVDE